MALTMDPQKGKTYLSRKQFSFDTGTITRTMMILMLRLALRLLVIIVVTTMMMILRSRRRRQSTDNCAWKWRNISECSFLFLAHLSFHLVVCEYFVYSPGFDENATKCQGETSREKPGLQLKIIKSKCLVREFLGKICPWKYVQKLEVNRFKGLEQNKTFSG